MCISGRSSKLNFNNHKRTRFLPVLVRFHVLATCNNALVALICDMNALHYRNCAYTIICTLCLSDLYLIVLPVKMVSYQK